MLIYQVALVPSGAQTFHATFASAQALAKAEAHPLQEIQLYDIAVDKDAVVRMLNGGPYKDWKLTRRWVMTKRGGFKEVDPSTATPPLDEAELERDIDGVAGDAFRALDAEEGAEPLRSPSVDASEVDDPKMEELMAKSAPALRKPSDAEKEAHDDWKARHVFKGHDYQTGKKK